jgi:hypothetical protein
VLRAQPERPGHNGSIDRVWSMRVLSFDICASRLICDTAAGNISFECIDNGT